MGFAQNELAAIAEAVSGRVLADLTPQLEAVADRIATKVIDEIGSFLDGKLGGATK